MDTIKILGQELMDWEDFTTLVIRFSMNFAIALILIRGIYYPLNKNREYLLTFFVFNVVIFFVCILLGSVKMKVGFAFGLFAVFSVLRYRTEQLPIKEMTFLFLCITIAVINALVNNKISFAEVLFTNIVILLVTLIVERFWLKESFSSKLITYEIIENIKPENSDALRTDLETRTGLEITNLEVLDVNFLRDTAKIRIYFHEKSMKK